jgi:hypothetical protein
MRIYFIILFLAAILCCGCQAVTDHVTKSLSTAANDHHRITTGAKSSYIASKGQLY